MFERSKILDEEFVSRLKKNDYPKALSDDRLPSGLTPERLISLFEAAVISRQLDLCSRDMKTRGESFYTIGSCGHEANAALGTLFELKDMCFLHYRSGAFMVARAQKLPGSTPVYDLLLSFAASSEDPISGGRHKVFGSLPLLVPPQTSTIASHLPKALGAAFSIPRAQTLKIKSVMESNSVVMCSFGDASANHSTSQGAFNAASWASFQNLPLPLVFVCEDNGIGISVHTPEGWIEQSFKNRPGMKYFSCDGLSLVDVYRTGREAINYARTHRRPVFLHLKLVRLLGHAGSDIEASYHPTKVIEQTEAQDPLLHMARQLIGQNILTNTAILDLYESVRERVGRVSRVAVTRPKLKKIEEIAASIVPTKKRCELPAQVDESIRREHFSSEAKLLTTKQHMAKLINWGLHDLMLRFKEILVFGEDVAQKGGVYNVTTNLFKKFGPARVFNTLLDEQTILGLAIGTAHNGFLPIPEIQFLAYVHNAEDQLRGEASTLSFFSEGRFTNPMVVRIAGLGYQKGFGGHFHNDNSLAIFRDIPGVVIAVPSNGADAVKMMRTCVAEALQFGRVVVFVEPIALYMARDLHQKGDEQWCFHYPPIEETLAFGEFNLLGKGEDVLVITYGNGVYYSLQAAKQVEKNIAVTILDLRWLAPIDEKKLAQVAAKFKKILIVDECRKTGSLSEYLVALLVEKLAQKLPTIKVIAAFDCFIPLGEAAASGLPSVSEIKSALEALHGK